MSTVAAAAAAVGFGAALFVVHAMEWWWRSPSHCCGRMHRPSPDICLLFDHEVGDFVMFCSHDCIALGWVAAGTRVLHGTHPGSALVKLDDPTTTTQ